MIFHIPYILWMGLIIYLSLSPPNRFPSYTIPHLDKAVHLILYGILYALMLYGWRRYLPMGMLLKRVKVFVFVYCLVFGIIIEVAQHFFTQGRSFDVWDILANTLGITVFYALERLLLKVHE
ncbi:MAG: VanZ family protein [Chitinophagales bacterium]|nr:VanZ family protein [Chitinophagales bacterium]MDW8273145.1 VanZ family protein [Chitinophagales bacterium]